MDARGVAVINITGSVVGIIAATALTYAYGTQGTLYSLVLGQALLLSISYPLFRRSRWFESGTLRPKLDSRTFGLLARYSLMALTSAIIAPTVQLAVRNHLVSDFSWHDAGCWEAVTKLSDAYLLTITMAISMYYLPRLSSAVDRSSLVAEVRSGYSYFMPVVVLAAIFIYVFRSELTILLFSEKFLSSLDLFAPQLIADVFKVASFMLSYVMIAKAMTRLFIASEIAFSATYFCLVLLLTDQYGPIGAMYASVVNYVAYFFFNLAIIKIYLNKLNSAI
jgi:PST family polysaccharide transporter